MTQVASVGKDEGVEQTSGLRTRVNAALFLFALVLRLPLLPLRRLVEGDGVNYALLARAILDGDMSGLANPYWSNLWPGVIAITAWFTDLDVVMAGRVASLIAGSLLAPATAALASRALGTRTGMIAGILVAVHPWLIQFSSLVFTESFFALLLVTALLSAVRRQTGPGVAATGVWTGLAMVTRPEAGAAMAAIIFGFLRRGRALGYKTVLRLVSLFVVVVFVFLLARALLTHHYFGSWDFGGTKGVANLFVGLAKTDIEKERVATEITPGGEFVLAKAAEETTLLSFVSDKPGLLVRHIWENIGGFTASSLRVFPLVPPLGGLPPLWQEGWPPWLAVVAAALSTLALVGLGLCLAAPHPPWLLVLTPLLYAAGLTLLNIHDRLVLPLVPLFLIFLAHAIARATRRLPTPGAGSGLGLALGLGLLSLLLVLEMRRAPALEYSGDPVVQRTAGEWLAAHYPQDTIFMTVAASVGFYFHDAAHSGLEVLIPWAEYSRVIEFARKERVRLIVAPEWHLRAAQHPAAEDLLEPKRGHPELRLVAELSEDGNRVFIYELQPLPGIP